MIIIPKLPKEKGYEGALLKLDAIPKFPASTRRLVEDTVSRVGNGDVMSYAINSAVSTFLTSLTAYRMNHEKAMGFLTTSIENACVLHSPELEISAQHMDKELRRLKMVKTKNLLEATPEELKAAHEFVQIASLWRRHGGRNRWKQDGSALKYILDNHRDDLPRAYQAIKDTRSVSAPFIRAMDSVPTPLTAGAL